MVIQEEEKQEEEDGFDSDTGMRVDIDTPDEEEDSDANEELNSSDEEAKKNKKKVVVEVEKGAPRKVIEGMAQKKQADEEKKLREMMIPKKHKQLYNKIMFSKKKQRQEVSRPTKIKNT